MAVLLSAAATSAMAECAEVPAPVRALDVGSRYADAGEGSRVLDAAASDAVDEELGPVDDFIRDLADAVGGVRSEDPEVAAGCVLAAMADWARAGALGDLRSRNAHMTLGSRLSGFGMIALQAAPHAPDPEDLSVVTGWLRELAYDQMTFWEVAPDGTAQGNLRAWAALGVASAARLADDPVLRGWAAWSVRYVACRAEPSGALPQEMTRGRHALHYQMHSVSALVPAAALLAQDGIDLAGVCGGAVHRAAGFALRDLIGGGGETRAITGEVQTYFDGTREIEGFAIAWLEAWQVLAPDADAEALAAAYRPLSNSKLGGDQTALWRGGAE